MGPDGGATKMTASEAFVEQPAAEGVTLVPGIVGPAYMDALDLFPAAGIRFLPVAHEQNAVHKGGKIYVDRRPGHSERLIHGKDWAWSKPY